MSPEQRERDKHSYHPVRPDEDELKQHQRKLPGIHNQSKTNLRTEVVFM